MGNGAAMLLCIISCIHASRGSLLIRKCCSETQQLNADYNDCVALEGRSVNGTEPTRKRVVEVLAQEGTEFPRWMDNTTRPLSAHTLTHVPSFLRDQRESQYIEFGSGPPCDAAMTLVMHSQSPNFHLVHNGSLIYHSVVNITFSPASYCTDSVKSGLYEFVYVVCSCLEAVCVKKCCPSSQQLSYDVVRAGVKTHCEPRARAVAQLPLPPPLVLFYNRGPECGSEASPVVLLNATDYSILRNGSVTYVDYTYSPAQYCWDTERRSAPVLRLCGRRVRGRAPTAEDVAYAALNITGFIFFALTVIMFAAVPETRKANTEFMVCHIGSQIVSSVFLAGARLTSLAHPVLCTALAFVIQFSFLAAFFWLNVMCIDISWAFSGFRPPQGSATERDRKKFLYYSLYAWGSPTVITIVTAVMEYVASIPDTYIKPDFGVKACWFKEKSATLAYFYGPMAALLLANFALFVYTSVKIILVQRATRILHNDESGSFNKDKKRLMLYGKLFCLMGLTWITEIISWAEGNMKYFWYVTDGINLLRAVFIFVIFCCKPKVFRLLKQRLHSWGLFPSYNPSLENGRSTGTRKSSSSTQQSSLHSLQMTQLGNGGSSHP